MRTAGAQSKFGLAPEQLDELAALVHGIGARVVGLHAHSGSGIRAVETWSETALFLARAAERFPHVEILDVGGGLGVPEQAGQSGLDLAALDELLHQFRSANPRFRLWLEPGRFLVAQAGVLLARVVQVKHKGEVNFVGLSRVSLRVPCTANAGAYGRVMSSRYNLREPAGERLLAPRSPLK